MLLLRAIRLCEYVCKVDNNYNNHKYKYCLGIILKALYPDIRQYLYLKHSCGSLWVLSCCCISTVDNI